MTRTRFVDGLKNEIKMAHRLQKRCALFVYKFTIYDTENYLTEIKKRVHAEIFQNDLVPKRLKNAKFFPNTMKT